MVGISPQIAIIDEACGRCGGCVPVCPTDAIYLSPLKLEIDDATCTACGNCVTACPVGALELATDG
jgi:ferredoxin